MLTANQYTLTQLEYQLGCAVGAALNLVADFGNVKAYNTIMVDILLLLCVRSGLLLLHAVGYPCTMMESEACVTRKEVQVTVV